MKLNDEQMNEAFKVIRKRDSVVLAMVMDKEIGDPMELPPTLAKEITQAMVTAYQLGFMAGNYYPDNPLDTE